MQKIKEIRQGDLLAFKASDNKYKVLLCTNIYKSKSPHYFTFAVLTYNSFAKPAIADILDNKFFGTGNTRNDNFTYSDKELDTMWTIHPEIKPYFLGSYNLTIWRKDFVKFHDNFELIGNLEIVSNLDKNGNGGMNASDWTYLNKFFSDNYSSILNNRGQKQFKVRSILIGQV